jgi:hypothetical protein
MNTQLEEMGIKMECKYIPPSQRNGKSWFENQYYLSWQCTINGKTFHFNQGSGHVTSREVRDMLRSRLTIDNKRMLDDFFEHFRIGLKKIHQDEPKLSSVLECLILDAEVLDHENFESWAACFGYDSDSISAKRTYDECLESSLRLISAIGCENIVKIKQIVSSKEA